MKNAAVTLLSIGMLACFIFAQSTTTSSSRPAPRWSKPVNNVRVAIATAGTPSVGGGVALNISLENTGTDAVSGKDGFVWVLLAQGRDKAYFTGRIPFKDIKAPLDPLAPGKITEGTFDLGALDVYAYLGDLEIVKGYPEIRGAKVLGKLQDLLPVGKIRAKVTVYLPSSGTLLMSEFLDFTVAEPDFAKLTGEARAHYLADMLAGFTRDAYSAKTAHDRVVKIGKDLTSEIVKLLDPKSATKLSDAGRMWAAATLCDLGDPRGVDTLVAVLKTGDSAANVVAYTGWKMTDKTLLDAINTAAGDNPLVAIWAARGSQEFAKKRRPELVTSVIAALEKADTKTKPSLIEGLERLTNQHFGADAAKWKAWWEKNGGK